MPTPAPSAADLYFLPAIIGVIIAILIVGAVLALLVAKKPIKVKFDTLFLPFLPFLVLRWS